MSDRSESVTAWACKGEQEAGRLTVDIGGLNARVSADSIGTLDERHPAVALRIGTNEPESFHLDVELTANRAEALAEAIEAAVEKSAAEGR